MAIMERKGTKSEQDAIIEAYLASCKVWVNNLKNCPTFEKEKEVPKVKKKSTTKAKKKYNVILKVACVLGAVLLLTLAYSTLFAPDVVNAIMVFFDFLGNPLKNFKGGRALDPSHFVMFIK